MLLLSPYDDDGGGGGGGDRRPTATPTDRPNGAGTPTMLSNRVQTNRHTCWLAAQQRGE